MIPVKIYLAPGEKLLIARFWQSASGFWRGLSAWRAWLLLVLLIATVLLQLPTQYWLNFWNRDFFNAIERTDGTERWAQALRFVPLAGASLTLAVFSVWARMTTQRRWREWLSNHLYDYWLQTIAIVGSGSCWGSLQDDPKTEDRTGGEAARNDATSSMLI